MMPRRTLTALWAVLACVAGCRADAGQTTAWLVKDGSTGAGLLRLTIARRPHEPETVFVPRIEESTLTLERTCEAAGAAPSVLWRDTRTWTDPLGVTPTEGWILVPPEHRDIVIVLASVEHSLAWGQAVRVDVFRVTPTPGFTVESAGPLTSLVRWRGKTWPTPRIFIGDAGLVVEICDSETVVESYSLDLGSLEWREACGARAIVPGVTLPKRTVTDWITNQSYEDRAPTSRPVAK